MEKYLDSFKFGENPAKKSPVRGKFLSTYNNAANKTRSLVDEQITPMKVVHNNYPSRIEGSPGLNISGKIRGGNYSPLKVAYRKSEAATINGAEKVVNFGKSNFVDPYPNAQLNIIDLFLGKWIERDYETAKKTGGLIIPKFIRASTIGSYVGKWLDTTLMPTKIPDLAWKGRQILNNIFIPPVSSVFRGINNVYKKGKKLFYSDAAYKKSNFESKVRQKKRYAKITSPVNYFRNWVNKDVKFKPRDILYNGQNSTMNFSKKLGQKNKIFQEKLKDAS